MAGLSGRDLRGRVGACVMGKPEWEVRGGHCSTGARAGLGGRLQELPDRKQPLLGIWGLAGRMVAGEWGV